MDPDQTARRRRLVWIRAGRKPIMFVLSWRGSFVYLRRTIFLFHFKFKERNAYKNANMINIIQTSVCCSKIHQDRHDKHEGRGSFFFTLPDIFIIISDTSMIFSIYPFTVSSLSICFARKPFFSNVFDFCLVKQRGTIGTLYEHYV
jgi:hypothetical protein